MHKLAERVLGTIREQQFLRAGDRVAVAVSGGADSVALLRLLLEIRGELGVVLSVAHVNHKLRGAESDEDQEFVETLARQHGLEFHLRVEAVARDTGAGIEAAAREARYDFFRELAREGLAVKVATAHTLDDQAETVMLRIFRGTGIRGLAGIHPRVVLREAGRTVGEVVRPVLGVRRAELLQYLGELKQDWREDSSNQSMDFARNRVRRQLLPQIGEVFGEAVVERMGELAEIARAEEEHWSTGHPELGKLLCGVDEQAVTLPVSALLALPLAAQRRVVREWIAAGVPGARISFRLIEQVLEVARGAAGRRLEMPAGWSVRRVRSGLTLEKVELSGPIGADYEYEMAVPGEVEVRELGLRLEARLVEVSEVPEDQRGQLLDPARLLGKLTVRNWRAGDRFWPAHTAAEKKVKDLLSDRHLTGTEKKLWPVVVGAGGLVWMRGFAVPAAAGVPAGAVRALLIRESAG